MDIPTTVEKARFHHLPSHQEHVDIPVGTTVRKLIKILKSMDFGDIGGMMPVELSDDTSIEVSNVPVDGGELMSSQRGVRLGWDYEKGRPVIFRFYNIQGG